VPVTVSMTDRFSNPVPDGTTANFQTALGGIQASCQTGTTTSGSGACVINWTSKAPYSISGNPQTTSGNANVNPAYCTGAGQAMGLCNTTTNGRSAVYVTAIGEESFKDATGSGYFNPGDTVAWNAANADNNFTSGADAGQPKPWDDTSEPFLNEWELYDSYGTPTYVLGEPFLDFNNNGKRDGPDGLVESALCQGPLCNTASSTVSISASNLIILSGSTSNVYVYSAASTGTGTNPTYTPGLYGSALAGTVFHYASSDAAGLHGGGLALNIFIYDDRLQQMPNATTLSFTLSTGMTATITSQLPGPWPCSTAGPIIDSNHLLEAGQYYQVTIAPPATPPTTGLVDGALYLTTKSPRGLSTTTQLNLAP
jgi:hypothetical protein